MVSLIVKSCGCAPSMNLGLFLYLSKNATTEAWCLYFFCFCIKFAMADCLKAALRLSEASFTSLPRVEYFEYTHQAEPYCLC